MCEEGGKPNPPETGEAVVPPLLSALVGDAEIEAFFTDAADLAAMLRFEAALAEAQAEAGLVPAEHAVRIAAACASFAVDRERLAAGLARDGVVVPEFVRQLRSAVGEPASGSLHKGATSQDVIDTSLVLRLAPLLGILDARLAAVEGALRTLCGRHGTQALMAQTRMQQALPIRVGDRIAAWRAPLGRHRERLATLRPRLLALQLGGPVGNRGELGPHADAVAAGVARRLGIGCPPPWHSQRDSIVEFGQWLALVAGSLGKVGQDVALMVQNEVGTARLAGGGTSSAMAHKANPVPAEVLVALARFTAGLSGTLAQALVHENERSGAAWTLEWLVLPQMVVAAGAALRTALRLAENLSFPEPA